MKVPYKVIAGILGVIGAIVWSIQGVNYNEVISAFTTINLFFAGTVLLLTMLNLLIRSYVWKFIVNPIKKIPLKHAFLTYMVGVFSNLFLPFKLGDIAQGYSLGEKQNMSKLSVVSAVFVQRIFEAASLLIIMLIVALFFSFPLLMKKQTMVLGLILICGIALIVLVYKNRQIITKTIDYIFGKIAPTIAPKVSNIFTNLIAGMVAIHNVSDFFKIISLSILSWFVQILMVYITAKSLDISIDIVASSIVLAIINVGLLIPLAPGNVGTFQVFCIIALSLFSVTKSKALSFSIIFQVIQGIPVIIGGSVSLFKQIIISRHTKMVSSDMKKEDQRGLII